MTAGSLATYSCSILVLACFIAVTFFNIYSLVPRPLAEDEDTSGRQIGSSDLIDFPCLFITKDYNPISEGKESMNVIGECRIGLQEN